jgi:hypothetical protein
LLYYIKYVKRNEGEKERFPSFRELPDAARQWWKRIELAPERPLERQIIYKPI